MSNLKQFQLKIYSKLFKNYVSYLTEVSCGRQNCRAGGLAWPRTAGLERVIVLFCSGFKPRKINHSI